MCDLCKKYGIVYCPDCGRMICWDQNGEDDISAPAYVTYAGDLVCSLCGRRADWERDHPDPDEWLHMWEHYPGTMLPDNLDFIFAEEE
jgi:uncharacterized Zn finger protein (UPF0148 family)